jgi:ATP-dependent Clp protease ATP-binding subunit ClpC
MTAKLLLYVCERPHGRVVVSSVDFPGVSVDAGDLASARAAVVTRLGEELRQLEGVSRAALAVPASAELDAVDVPLASPKGVAKQARITVGLVVIHRPTTLGDAFVVRAPDVPRFHLTLADREQLHSVAREVLGKALANWDVAAAMACDQTGSVRLETVELPFPSPAEDSRGGEAFVLEDVAVDMAVLAKRDPLDRLDRRDALVERVLAALVSSGRSSVMLVGAPDVGKTALLYELASRLSAGEVPPGLRGRALWRLSANELIAGAVYTGMWQDRARMLVARARSDNSMFAMGDPVGIIDAGRWSGSDNNMARYLRPYLESGDLTVICECTSEVFAAARKKEPSFVDSFHRIDVPEPEVEDAREIVALAARRLEEARGVRVAGEAVGASLELTHRFEPYRGLPGKAVRLLDESVQRADAADAESTVGRDQVVSTFSARTGLPLFMLSDDMPMRVEEVREYFEQRVLGQPEAVSVMIDVVAVAKAGLNDPRKPLGTFVFVGSTGVGKTELTKALAEFLFGNRDRVIRFDMGEFATPDAVSRLVGTAWRSDGEGELTRRVREQPFCVLLLDEIEKAHADVYDVLLSVLGEGRLTDANGRTADFRNAIIVMTSNLGSDRAGSHAVGFGGGGAGPDEAERLRQHFVDQAERFFRPEFFNRIDRVVTFHPLSPETVRTIARRDVGRLLLREGVARRRLLVEIDDDVIAQLAESGFHPKYGARPLQREIERTLIQPLARLIVERRPAAGDLIRFSCDDGRIEVESHGAPAEIERRPRPKRPEPETGGSLVRAQGQVADLVARIVLDANGALAEGLRGERSGLVEQTNAPGFWDTPDEARRTLERLYQIDRVLERLDRLRQRAEGLHELAVALRRSRDRSRLTELRHAVAELEDVLSVVRLELAGAVLGEDDGAALVRVVPVGDADEWAGALLAMYEAWAARTGRVCERLDKHRFAVRIEGLSSHSLLGVEAGLHRRIHGQHTWLARVVVLRDGSLDPLPAEASDEGGDVVRIYSEGRQQFVRDPRSGVRVGDVSGVLDHGRIDEFIIGGVTLDTTRVP